MIISIGQGIDGGFFSCLFKQDRIGDRNRGCHTDHIDLISMRYISDRMSILMTHQQDPNQFSV